MLRRVGSREARAQRNLQCHMRSRKGHSVCLAAHVSGGFKSRSARGHGLISQGGGNASRAEGGGRYGDADTGTQAQAGHSPGRPEAPSTVLDPAAGRASTARWSRKGLRRTTGASSMGELPGMNRSANDGEWSSRPYGGEGLWFHPIAPRCVRATRGERGVGDPGRPGIVRAAGRVESGRHPQTTGRATENAHIDLKPPGGRGG